MHIGADTKTSGFVTVSIENVVGSVRKPYRTLITRNDAASIFSLKRIGHERRAQNCLWIGEVSRRGPLVEEGAPTINLRCFVFAAVDTKRFVGDK